MSSKSVDLSPVAKRVLEANVWYVGVRKRCRKVERHHIPLGDHDPETVDRAALLVRAREALAKDAKTVHTSYLELQPVEVGDGCRSYKIGLGSAGGLERTPLTQGAQ